MRKALIALVALAGMAMASCEQSEGSKYGLLQKVSHKTSPCDYYELEVAYAGGVNTGTSEDPAFANTQKFQIDKAAYDTLIEYQGEQVIVSYIDNGFQACGSSKWVSSVRIKSPYRPVTLHTPKAEDEVVTVRVPSRTDSVYIYRPSVDSMLPPAYDSQYGK